MRTTGKRNDVLDIVKGIAAILVVWGHTIQYFSVGGFDFWESSIFRMIYSFHMPLFMLVSGYLFYWTCSRKTWTEVISGRIRGIGVPMIVWGTIIWLIRSRQNLTIGRWVGEIIGIWFLYAVIISSAIVVTIAKCKVPPPPRAVHYAIIFAAGLIIIFAPSCTNVMYVYPYFVAGYALNEQNLLKKRKINLLYILGWLILIPFYRKEDFIYTSGLFPASFQGAEIIRALSIDLYRWTIGFFGSMAVISIVQEISAQNTGSPIKSFLARIGRHTVEIYVMQRLVLEIMLAKGFEKGVFLLGKNHLAGNRLVYYTATLLFSLALTSLLVYIAKFVEKNRLLSQVLFGKK